MASCRSINHGCSCTDQPWHSNRVAVHCLPRAVSGLRRGARCVAVVFHHDWQRLRATNKTTALTARRARPVRGIGMYHADPPVLSAPSAPT
ncbi:hypothetical protein [Xanthomonas oryzae pv. oryzae MAFF 311018]|nr:hypothetical protein [Xanthomonas oryzae pv. oryzae MAFF 311018]